MPSKTTPLKAIRNSRLTPERACPSNVSCFAAPKTNRIPKLEAESPMLSSDVALLKRLRPPESAVLTGAKMDPQPGWFPQI